MGNESKQPVIVISRTDRLGDVLLSFPAFQRLRESFPHARIIILIRNYTKDLFHGQTFMDRVLCADDFTHSELLSEIQQEHPTHFIALFTDKHISELARRSGAANRVGPLSKSHSWFSFNHGVFQKRSRAQKSEVEYNLDLVRSLTPNFQEREYTPTLFCAESHRRLIAEFLQEQRISSFHRLVVINPFCGGSAKNLTPDQYRYVAKGLTQSDPDVRIIYSVTPADPYLTLEQEMGAQEALFISKGSILHFVALMEKAQLYLGASTGTTHIAAFMHKPILAVFPRILNQSPKRWGLIGSSQIHYIQPDAPCRRKYGCKSSCRYYDCFQSIDLDNVIRIGQRYLHE